MQQTNPNHPAHHTFDHLLGLRAQIAANPKTSWAQFATFCLPLMRASPAQLFQDLFVLFVLKRKTNGIFVEFGAADGVMFSNTLLLERQFGWTGILAEPATCWHDALKTNRRAKIDFRCVWKESGQSVQFNETTMPELSTITEFTDSDFNKGARTESRSLSQRILNSR